MYRVAFVDTETTGFTAGNTPWHVGVVNCDFDEDPNRNPCQTPFVDREEFVLPILTADLGQTAFQRGTIIDYCREDCDEAADYARDWCEVYDREEFLDHMRTHLETVCEERSWGIFRALSDADEIWAWNAKFDRPILEEACKHYFDVECAMELFKAHYPGIRYKLATAADYFDIAVNGVRHHTALYDAELCMNVWFRMKLQCQSEADQKRDREKRIAAAFGRRA